MVIVFVGSEIKEFEFRNSKRALSTNLIGVNWN